MSLIYFDHAASTPVRPEVVEAMLPYFTEHFANPSSVHVPGQRAKKGLEDARESVAACLGAKPGEIFFTSGGTESDNLGVRGVAYANRQRGKHVITSAIEHRAVLNTCLSLADEGFEVTTLPVDRSGAVEVEALKQAIRPGTVVVSVMLANNETGVLQPLREIARITRERGIAFHTDAVQGVGKMPVNVDELGVDLLSIAAHKFYGPKGVGALYVRDGVEFEPILHGGHHERSKRPGTQNVAGAAGLAKALEMVTAELVEAPARLAALRDRLERGILQQIQQTRVNGHPERRLPNILNMSFEDIEGAGVLIALDAQGIAVSAGPACRSGAAEPSHVLKAMGVEAPVAVGAVRFSFGHGNTAAEVDHVLEVLVGAVQDLREHSPLKTVETQE